MRIAVWFGVRGEPSALRWMAARAEFALVWREVVGIGALLDAGWLQGLSLRLFDGRWWASALRWMLAGFVEGFVLTFWVGVVILRVHIWEHSGLFGQSDPHMVVCKYGGEDPVVCVRVFLLPL